MTDIPLVEVKICRFCRDEIVFDPFAGVWRNYPVSRRKLDSCSSSVDWLHQEVIIFSREEIEDAIVDLNRLSDLDEDGAVL